MARGKQSTVVKQRPLTGPFDARSEPEEIPKDGWRMLQNIGCTGIAGRLCRQPQWSRLFPATPYNNADLHDQLLALQIYYDTGSESVQTSGVLVVGRQYRIDTLILYDDFSNVGATNVQGEIFTATGTTPTTWASGSNLTALVYVDDSPLLSYPPANDGFSAYCGSVRKTRTQGRQPITFLAQVESSASTRRLLAGTQSRLYSLTERGGNWRIIGDGFGGVADNPEIRWRHTRVGDYVILSNDYDEVQYWPYDAPPSGCAMRAVKPIPELQTIGVSKAKVLLEFRGIIILANIEEDGQRKTNMVRWSGLGAPLEWIEDPGVSTAGHQELDYGEEILAGGTIGNFAFLYTNRGIWQIAVSADPAIVFDMRKVYSSDQGESCIRYPNTFMSIGDAHLYMANDAIYAWSQYSPRPERVEWIHRASEILYDGINDSNCAVHTAGFDPLTKQVYFSCALGEETLSSVTLVCNVEYRQAYKLDHGFSAFTAYVPDGRPSIRDFFVENCLLPANCFTGDEAAELGAVDLKEGTLNEVTPSCPAVAQHIYTDQSLAVEAYVSVEDYNQATASGDSMCALVGDMMLNDLCRKCDGASIFIGASAGDWCLKQFGTVYYRERHVANGVYVQDGYQSRMLKCLPGSSELLAISRVLLQFNAELQATPLKMNLRVGASNRAEDPLEACSIQWNDEGGRDIDCLANDKGMEWLVWAAENFLYLDFTIDGVGGASCFSSMELELQKVC